MASLILSVHNHVDLHFTNHANPGPVFSYKFRYIVGFWLVEMAISTNQKPTIYRNLYENTVSGVRVACTYIYIYYDK